MKIVLIIYLLTLLPNVYLLRLSLGSIMSGHDPRTMPWEEMAVTFLWGSPICLMMIGWSWLDMRSPSAAKRAARLKPVFEAENILLASSLAATIVLGFWPRYELREALIVSTWIGAYGAFVAVIFTTKYYNEVIFRRPRWYDYLFLPVTFVAHRLDLWRSSKKPELASKINDAPRGITEHRL